MALTDEQNAMLRLLTSGEQGYADIAALLGQSEDEVRAKVVGALAQLQAEGKPAPDVPPPIARGAKPAAEATPPEPEPVEKPPAASEESTEPAIADAVAPSPSGAVDAAPPKAAPPAHAKPSAPKSAAPPAASTPPSGNTPSGGRTVTLPSGRKAWLLSGGIVAAIVVIVVVILLASGGGGGGSSTASTETPTTPAAGNEPEEGKAETTAGAKPATEAPLKAVDGSNAKGFASFGRVKNKLALQIEATGLEPTEEGTTSYAIWLAESPRKMIPLASTGVKATGKGAKTIAAQFEVPVEVLAYLASGTFDQIAVTKVENKRFETAIEVATKKKTTPTYYGEEVLRGTITGPIVGLALREEEEKKAEEAGE